jgi:hypothetical protein
MSLWGCAVRDYLAFSAVVLLDWIGTIVVFLYFCWKLIECIVEVWQLGFLSSLHLIQFLSPEFWCAQFKDFVISLSFILGDFVALVVPVFNDMTF